MQHSSSQLLRGEVDQFELSSSADHPIWHSLSDPDTEHLFDSSSDAFDVLNIQGRNHINAGTQEIQHVLVALLVGSSARNVGVCEFIDQHNLGVTRQHRSGVHLRELMTLVVDDLLGYYRYLTDQLLGVSTTVGLHKADHDVSTSLQSTPALVQHRTGLTHTGHRTQVNSKATRRLDITAKRRTEPTVSSFRTSSRRHGSLY